MFKYIYGTSRDRNYQSALNIASITMNGWYTTEFMNYWQFQDFALANIVKLDMPIPNDKYTGKIPVIDPVTEEPTGELVPKLTKFVRLKYSDIYTTASDLQASIEKSSSDTNVQIFSTPEEAISWLKANTNLVEETPWKFLVHPERPDMMNPEVTIPAEYLTIV